MARVMVVEAESIIARDIKETLATIGHEVPAVATTAEDAFDKAMLHRPELILMDTRLRGDISGIQAATKIRERLDVPIIFLTAYADSDSIARAKLSGPHGYVLKPYNDKELRGAIDVALHKHGITRQPRNRQRLFSAILTSIGDGVIATDQGDRVTFMNPIAERLTGWTHDDAIGHPVADVVRLVREDGRASVECPTARALRERAVVGLDRAVLLVSREGKDVPIDDSAAPIIDASGKLMGVVLVFRDVSERQKLEARLAMSDRLAALGTTTAGIAHEINNPLTYNLANLAYAVADFPVLIDEIKRVVGETTPAWPSIGRKCEELQTLLQQAQEGAERIRRIVEDMKTFARHHDETFHVAELPKILETAVRISWNEIRHRARLVQDIRQAPDVRCNEGQLGQVFVNLLVNAAQAIAEGSVEQNEIRLLLETDADGCAVVEVSDTGCGIAPEVMVRLFDPFFTTKPVGIGSGLGLSVCHTLLTAHGGEITVKSQLGKGSVFRVRLPPARAGAKPAADLSVQAPKPVHNARILIIDDEKMIGDAMRRMLTNRHEVVVMTSAKEALRLLERDVSFDVVFCDLMMPEMTGMDFYEWAVANRPHLAERMLFTTGGAFTTRSKEFIGRMADRRVDKPFDPAKIAAMIADLLKLSRVTKGATSVANANAIRGKLE